MSIAIRAQVKTPEEEAPETLVEITNPHFRRGYELGRTWHFYGRPDWIPPITDEYLIVNIVAVSEKQLHTEPDYLATRLGDCQK